MLHLEAFLIKKNRHFTWSRYEYTEVRSDVYKA